MSHSPLIRTVVNLSLIVALMIQPMVASAALADCAAGCSANFTCQGCGCCEVESSTELCGCCGGGKPTDSPEEFSSEKSCCSHGDDGIPETSVSDTPTVVVQSVFSDCDLTEPTPPISSDGAAVVAAEKHHEFHSACLCQQEELPLGDPSPRRPASEDRDEVSLGYAKSNASDFGNHADRRSVARSDVAPSLRQFSQAMICIWRL